MPTINNIYSKLVSKLSQIPFTVLILEVESGILWQLNNIHSQPTKDTSFTIVLDQSHQDSPINYPDTYYCNTEAEVEQVIGFITENMLMYVDNVINYEYDTLLDKYPYKVIDNPIEYIKTM